MFQLRDKYVLHVVHNHYIESILTSSVRQTFSCYYLHFIIEQIVNVITRLIVFTGLLFHFYFYEG